MADINGFAGTAWSIDGAEHPASLLRLAAYAFTSGAEGVVSPEDLKVQQLGVAGTQVRMNAGAAEFVNRSSGAGKETYIVQAPGESRLDVAPNNSTTTTRYDLVCVRVEDPEFALPSGVTGPPDDEAAVNWQYVRPFIRQNVPANTRRWSQIAEAYSAYACALLVIPPSTGTITDEMIVDLRKVARPHIEPNVLRFSYAAGASHDLISVPWQSWPNQMAGNIEIPEWASELQVEATLGGIAALEGPTSGFVRFRLGSTSDSPLYSASTSYDSDIPAGSYVERMGIPFGDTIAIPAAKRGTTQPFAFEGHKNSTAGFGRLVADEFSQLFLKLTFVERAA